jgi:putative DNA primase/helicase
MINPGAPGGQRVEMVVVEGDYYRPISEAEPVDDAWQRGGGGGGARQEPSATPLSDDYLHQLLSDQELVDDYIYCAVWKTWLRYERYWRREATLLVEDLARRVCRRASEGLEDKRLARTVDSERSARAAEHLARANRRHAIGSDRFDADPMVLGTPGGMVDLNTGQAGPHRREAYLTKQTAVHPEPMECPLWRRVLNDATGGNEANIAFLQRYFGAAIVGAVSEHVVLVFHGSVGGEGKSLIINAIAGAMGDYAVIAAPDLLTPVQGERHTTDLAALAGARLVVVNEIEQGRHWAESKLKSISGGDKITARFMRGDFFTFQPQFTLIVATNNLPKLRSAGGMRRRLQIVPFRHRPEAPDPELPEKLKAEWPGILAWAIQGTIEWRRRGLAPPPDVIAATDEYFAQENSLASWIGERCVKEAGGQAFTAELFRDYEAWAKREGEEQPGKRQFAQRLIEAGFELRKIYVGGGEGRGCVGLRLRNRGLLGGGK